MEGTFADKAAEDAARRRAEAKGRLLKMGKAGAFGGRLAAHLHEDATRLGPAQ